MTVFMEIAEHRRKMRADISLGAFMAGRILNPKEIEKHVNYLTIIFIEMAEGKYRTKLTDNSPMPWGKFQGVKMANVPAKYLLWLNDSGKASSDVKNYIIENLDVLKKEIEQ